MRLLEGIGAAAGSLVRGYRKATSPDGGFGRSVVSMYPSWQRSSGVTGDGRATSDAIRYATSDDVYAAVNVLADAAASIPFRVVDPAGDEVPDSDLAFLLSIGNGEFGGVDFWGRVYRHLWLNGECFLFVDRNNPVSAGMPNQLWPVAGANVKVHPGASRLVERYSYTPPGGSADIPVAREDVVPLTLWHPTEPLRGLSPLSALRMGLESERQAKATNLDMFRNGLHLDGVLSVPGANPSAMEDLRKEFAAVHGAEGKRHGIAVIPGDVKLERLQLSPADVQFIELDRLTTRDVAKAYRIPAMMLGDLSDATYSNYDTAWTAFYQLAVLPTVRLVADKVTVHLGWQFGDELRVKPDTSEVQALQDDIRGQAETVGVLVRGGIDRLWAMRMVFGEDVPEEAIAEDFYPVIIVPVGEQPAVGLAPSPPKAWHATGQTQRKAAGDARGDRARDRIVSARLAIQPPHMRAVDRVLRDEAAIANAALPAAWPAGKAAGFEISNAVWAAVLAEIGTDDPLLPVIAGMMSNGAEAGMNSAAEVFGLRVDPNRAEPWAVGWARREAAEKVKWVNEATRARLNEAIVQALTHGEGINGARARIREAFLGSDDPAQIAAYGDRVENIVQTELASAYNAGHHEAFLDSGVPYQQWWYSGLPESRHGPSRRLGHGQLKRMDERFTIGEGGYTARYPADPSLPVGQRARCKCVLLAVDNQDAADILAAQAGE